MGGRGAIVGKRRVWIANRSDAHPLAANEEKGKRGRQAKILFFKQGGMHGARCTKGGGAIVGSVGIELSAKRTLCKQMCQCSRAALALSLFARGWGAQRLEFSRMIMAGVEVGFACKNLYTGAHLCSPEYEHQCTGGGGYRRQRKSDRPSPRNLWCKGASYLKAFFCVQEYIQTLVSY